jgi:hypothetical protein
MNGGNKIHNSYNNYNVGKNVREGDCNGELLKIEEPKKFYATAEAVKKPLTKYGSDHKVVHV